MANSLGHLEFHYTFQVGFYSNSICGSHRGFHLVFVRHNTDVFHPHCMIDKGGLHIKSKSSKIIFLIKDKYVFTQAYY